MPESLHRRRFRSLREHIQPRKKKEREDICEHRLEHLPAPHRVHEVLPLARVRLHLQICFMLGERLTGAFYVSIEDDLFDDEHDHEQQQDARKGDFEMSCLFAPGTVIEDHQDGRHDSDEQHFEYGKYDFLFRHGNHRLTA